VGVYIFHIAAASFYHYMTAYFFAESSATRRQDHALSPAAILLVNAGTMAAGCAWGGVVHAVGGAAPGCQRPDAVVEAALRAFPLMMGIPKQEFSGVFIGQNAYSPSSPELHLQGKCSSLSVS
jgi:hypothetical protein